MPIKIPQSCRWKNTGKTLGQGGQAAVFVVQDTESQFDGELALKALAKDRPRVAYQRFHREIEAIRSLNHRGIVRIMDAAGPDEAFQFYVMEYHPGAKSLKQLIQSDTNPFAGDPLKSVSLFIAIAEALAHCQQHEVLHRDLSPANVLILPDNAPMLIDFGLCQIADHQTVTLADEGVGTPNYMAPECEAGSEGRISSLSDIYSLGKVLWSAITNRMAFAREKPAFGNKSMSEMFPVNPMTWHLHHIFEGTIRRKPENRFTPRDAIDCASQAEVLIRGGYPPFEKTQFRCAQCGWSTLEEMKEAGVFHNPLPSGMTGVRCRHCGWCFVVDRNVRRAEQERREALD